MYVVHYVHVYIHNVIIHVYMFEHVYMHVHCDKVITEDKVLFQFQGVSLQRTKQGNTVVHKILPEVIIVTHT